MSYVPAEGPKDAQIAFLGEGPGREELRLGRPFVGPSGQQLDDILRRCGLSRSKVYITNVVKDSMNKPSDLDIEDLLPDLLREFAALPKCNVVVPLGAVALRAISGWEFQSITRYRGSILRTIFNMKIVPTYHPAWYMRGEWRFKPVVVADVEKAVRVSGTPDVVTPHRVFVLEPTFEQAIGLLQSACQWPEMTIDIETFDEFVACIGFARDAEYAFCVPIMRARMLPYWSEAQETIVWYWIANVMNSRSRKIFQNGMFDTKILSKHGCQTRNFYHDTMLSHHLVYPELPHGLDFITSIYTDMPYYKDEGKSWDHNTPDRQLWEYNAKDCVATAASKAGLVKDLEDEGMQAYFQEYVMQLPPVLTSMTLEGIRVDKPKLEQVKTETEERVRTNQAKLNASVGRAINVKSPKDMTWLLSYHGIKATRFTPTGRPKLDEESLKSYVSRQPHQNFLDVFEIRKDRTMLSGFLSLETDAAGFYHPDYLIHGTKSGRLSSRGSGEGPQIQNIPKKVRGIFVPDQGYEIYEADLKQAEAMVVAWLAQDESMMSVFINGIDIHRLYAGICWSIKPEDVTYEQREIAKRIEHGTNYKMGPRKLAAILQKAGYLIQEKDAKRFQEIYLSYFPGIKNWHREVEDAVRTTRTLTTPIGRKRLFMGIFDDDLVREAISYVPQATVGQITNEAIIKIHKTRQAGQYDGRVLTQVHDSAVTQGRPTNRESNLRLLKSAMTRPMVIHGRELTIPVELKFGSSWGNMEEVQVAA